MQHQQGTSDGKYQDSTQSFHSIPECYVPQVDHETKQSHHNGEQEHDEDPEEYA